MDSLRLEDTGDSLYVIDGNFDEMSYFKDMTGHVQYLKKCESCRNECKQSFHVLGLRCSKFQEG